MTPALDMADIALTTQDFRPAIVVEAERSSAFDPDRPTHVGGHGSPWVLGPASDDDSDNGDTLLGTLLGKVVVLHTGPRSELARELERKAQNARDVRQGYRLRISDLRIDAQGDELAINQASEEDLQTFLEAHPFLKRGLLALVDNGNLRAVWKDELGNHLGLQFLGKRRVQYVLFKRRAGKQLARVSGRDTLSGIDAQIRAFELDKLIYA